MFIQKLSDSALRREYGILCQRFYPTKADVTPFGSSHCVVEPGGATSPHGHPDGETFIILEGEGEMRIGTELARVSAGDVVYIPSHQEHELVNRSERPLRFLSVWWDGHEPRALAFEKSLITVAPPTPNGGLHLGHLSGPYVAGDVYRRYLRLKGVETRLLTGSDDNQSYVPAKARKLGWKPERVADHFTDSIRSTLQRARVEVDIFLRPRHDPGYVAFVQGFVEKLFREGKLVEREVASPYCEGCAMHLFEAHLSGLCPHCGEGTNANGCEKCGIPSEGATLRERRCNLCGAEPTLRPLVKLVFPLARYAATLERFHAEARMSARLRGFVRRLRHQGLSDVSASFRADWGIPVPIAGYEGQVIYEWLEMAAGYLYAGEQSGVRPFDAQSPAELVQFFGFDNAFFYTTFLPALFLAYDEAARLPRAFVTNEFYRLEGLKFSTSRNHAIWGDEMLETVPADIVRFYLAHTRPESEGTNFTLAGMRDFVRRELVDGVGAWLDGLDNSLDAAGRAVPAFAIVHDSHAAFHRRLRELSRRMDAHYRAESFSLNEAARDLLTLVRWASDFGKRERLDELDADSAAAVLGLELAALRLFAVASLPLMPTLAERLLSALGCGEARWDDDVPPPAAGTVIGALPDGGFTRAVAALEELQERRSP